MSHAAPTRKPLVYVAGPFSADPMACTREAALARSRGKPVFSCAVDLLGWAAEYKSNRPARAEDGDG